VSVARAGASEPTGDYSTWSLPSLGVLVAGLLGAVLLIAADFSTLVEIKVITVTKERLSGHEQHSWAMVILGVAAIPMAYGAARRRARPAMLGLVLLGTVALLIALIGDLPDTRSTGVIGERYEEAAAQAGAGFFLETAGAVLLIVGGVGGLLLLNPPPAQPAAREPERTP
jgi:hypothetical protein